MAMATFVAGAAAAAAFFMLGKDPNMKFAKINNARYSAEMIKENLMAMLDNDAVWAKTVEKNPKLACLRAPGTCNASNFGVIDIYDADGNLVDTTTGSRGYDYSGRPCDRFSLVRPDTTCVFRYTVRWECSGACGTTTFVDDLPVAVNPKIRLLGSFEFAAKDPDLKDKLTSKNKAFTFDFVRAAKAKTLSQYCQSIEGIFDQRSGTCKSALSTPDSFDCTVLNGPHSWFVGFESDGTPICKDDAKLGQACPNGTAMLGYTQDGRIQCGPF